MIRTIDRRQFLVGASGFTLALPTLASLLPRDAQAAGPRKRFVAFWTYQGGVRTDAMYPGDGHKTRTLEIHPGHVARYGPLTAEVANGRASLSRVLSASSTALTQRLVSKMNVLQGLDVMFYMGHNEGVALGNFGNVFEIKGNPQRATIDQVMAWSPAFYPDLASVRQRSLAVVTSGAVTDRLSFRCNVGNDYKSGVTKLSPEPSAKSFFGKIFVPEETLVEVDRRPPVVDRVLEAYRSTKSGAFGDARRLSAADKLRLDGYMDRLSELQRKLKAAPAAASCGGAAGPAVEPRSAGSKIKELQLWNEVVAAAFLCGTCRVATIKVGEQSLVKGFSGSWHQDIIHTADVNDAAHDWVVKANQAFFEQVYLDLVQRLDVDDGRGSTCLDNSLVLWTQESGPMSHDNDSTPAICTGGAAGGFKTGFLVDYRNTASRALQGSLKWSRAPGIPYNRWLATVLQVMGIPKSEWERPGEKGYGDQKNTKPDLYKAAMMADASVPLPMIT